MTPSGGGECVECYMTLFSEVEQGTRGGECAPSQKTLKTAIVPIMKGGRAVKELFKEKSKKILQTIMSLIRS